MLQDSQVNYVVFEAFDAPWKRLPGQENDPDPFPNPETPLGRILLKTASPKLSPMAFVMTSEWGTNDSPVVPLMSRHRH
jgi:hypothetical protein